MDPRSFVKETEETGCDGLMVGRGIFGNPWFFSREVNRDHISVEDRLHMMVEHTKRFETMLPMKSFAIMKKHYKAYVEGFDGAKELRMRLMEEAINADAVEQMVEEFLRKR